jgi:hypothetical protein
MTGATLLLRQINPSWVQAGRVTSQAFKPTPKDKKRLSVYDGDQVTAEDSWRHYTEQLKYSSVGVMAVTVGDCRSLNLPVEPDPEPFPEHVVIRFDDCSNSQIETKAKHLKKSAEERGWLYQAESRV